MIHSVRFTAVLDTNVIYPLVVRDLLFWLAHYDLYTAKWSEHIFDEWRRLMRDKGVPESELENRIARANSAFPDAQVTNYHSLIECLELSDENDRHVLAAAIKTNANVIVTHNLKDFPQDYLSTFGLSAKDPDDFITDVIDLNPDEAVKAFRELVSNKMKPDLDEYQVLDSFRNNGLTDAADYLHSQL
jgi:predicted nucleic acid-binding protein